MDAAAWVDSRAPSALVHLDVAGSGRLSRAALDAEVAHLLLEAEVGGYVAQEQAAPGIDAGRAALGRLVGLSGADVCFLDGAAPAFATMLAAWPLPRKARIGYVASEFGSNARALRRLAEERGWDLELLPVDGCGRVLDVPAGLDLVTLPQVASQRGVLQPVEAVLATGIPLLLDVAQSLGQVPVPPGCAAYVGTSRKWLCGPRGVGFALVPPEVQAGLREPPTLAPTHGKGMLRWESQEAHIAGRVGLAVAAQEWSPAVGDAAVRIAAYARATLHGRGGWQVREPLDEPTALTTLEGGDPASTRRALLGHGFLTSAVPASRSDDLAGPVLRVSTAAWVSPAQIEACADALVACSH